MLPWCWQRAAHHVAHCWAWATLHLAFGALSAAAAAPACTLAAALTAAADSGLGAFMGGLGVLGTAFKLVWFVLGVVWLAGTDTSSCPAAGGALWALTCAFVATNCAALLLGLLVWLALQPMHDQRSFLPLHAAAPGSAAAAPVGTATPPGQLQMKARAGFAPDAVAARWHQRWQAQTTAAQASPTGAHAARAGIASTPPSCLGQRSHPLPRHGTAFARSTALALAGLLPVYCLAAAQVLCLFRGVCAAPHSPTVAPAASMAVVPVLGATMPRRASALATPDAASVRSAGVLGGGAAPVPLGTQAGQQGAGGRAAPCGARAGSLWASSIAVIGTADVRAHPQVAAAISVFVLAMVAFANSTDENARCLLCRCRICPCWSCR